MNRKKDRTSGENIKHIHEWKNSLSQERMINFNVFALIWNPELIFSVTSSRVSSIHMQMKSPDIRGHCSRASFGVPGSTYYTNFLKTLTGHPCNWYLFLYTVETNARETRGIRGIKNYEPSSLELFYSSYDTLQCFLILIQI